MSEEKERELVAGAIEGAWKAKSADEATVDIYISQSHAVRALGYLGARLAEDGVLPEDFEQPRLLLIWGDALAATMQLDDYSPADGRHFTEAVR